jgi:hypothetical protein
MGAGSRLPWAVRAALPLHGLHFNSIPGGFAVSAEADEKMKPSRIEVPRCEFRSRVSVRGNSQSATNMRAVNLLSLSLGMFRREPTILENDGLLPVASRCFESSRAKSTPRATPARPSSRTRLCRVFRSPRKSSLPCGSRWTLRRVPRGIIRAFLAEAERQIERPAQAILFASQPSRVMPF